VQSIHKARHFPIPQVGYSRRLSSQVTLGVSAFSAGLGMDFSRSPYERFGAEPSGSLSLTQSGVALAGAYEPVPGQVMGFSVNPAYQVFEVTGLQAFATASEAPTRFSDNSSGGAFGVSFTWAWHGALTPWLDAALSYRTRTFTERVKRYSGLIPDQGRLQTPAVWGGGFSFKPHADWTIAIEGQRVEYGSEIGYGNGIAKLEAGAQFGSDDGPSFGWSDQNIYKLGIAWQATEKLRVMAGGSHATQLIPEEEMFLGMLAPGVLRMHYTTGARYQFERWQVAGYVAYSPTQFQRGTDSIPAAFGGGDAAASIKMHMFGISFGRSF
jgi:long-chain fatty acid transport protein